MNVKNETIVLGSAVRVSSDVHKPSNYVMTRNFVNEKALFVYLCDTFYYSLINSGKSCRFVDLYFVAVGIKITSCKRLCA